MDGRSKLEDVFNTFDRNDSKQMKLADLGKGLRVAGFIPTESQLEELTRNAICINGNYIDLQEFTRLAGQCKKLSDLSKEEVSEYFNSFSSEKDDLITLDELKKALCSSGDRLSPKEVERLFKDFDSENSGRVSIRELSSGLLDL
jgi:Ca2+-binding EF-hand superfamily protein